MSEISRTSENNRLAYSNDTNRLGVSNNNTQTNDTSATGGVSRKDYLEDYITKKQKQIENGDIHDGSLAQQQEWVQSAIQMLHSEFPETSDWPGADPELVGFQASVRPTSTNHSETQKYFEYRSGSNTRVVVDRGDPNDARPTTAQFWTKDNGICLPDNASDVSYSYDKSDPKDPKITVQIHFPDGATKTMVYHNVDRPGFKLKIEAANPDAVKLNLSQLGDAAKKVTVTQYKEATDDPTSGERAGDKPTGTEDGADLYDTRKDVNIFPVADGSDHRTIVRSGGNVNITANSNSEYYKVEYTGGKYLVHVFANEEDAANGVEKEVIEVDAKLAKKLNFDIDPSRITFSPPLSSNTDNNGQKIDGPLDPKAEGASKINIISDGAVTTAPGDTQPTDSASDTATYQPQNGTDPVTITNNSSSGVTNHKIYTRGEIHIKGNPTDSATVEKTSDNPPMYKVTVTSTSGKPQVYLVDSEMLSHLSMDGIPNSRIIFKGLSTGDTSKILSNGEDLHWWLRDPKNFGEKGLVPTGGEQAKGIDLLNKVRDAELSGNWDSVIQAVNANGPGAASKLVTALWYAAGGSENDHGGINSTTNPEAAARFKKLLGLLPANVRDALKGQLGGAKGDDTQDNCVFTYSEAVAQLNL